MNKAILIDEISTKMDKTKKETEQFVDAFIDTVTETLVKGEKIQIVGFGSWEPTVRKGRTGRNPRSGESIIIPDTKSVKFKVGKILKQSVKQN